MISYGQKFIRADLNLKKRSLAAIIERIQSAKRELERAQQMLIVYKERLENENEIDNIITLHISNLTLDTRTENCFRNVGIETIGDVASCTEAELLRIYNFGKVCLKVTKDALAEYGLSIGDFS